MGIGQKKWWWRLSFVVLLFSFFHSRAWCASPTDIWTVEKLEALQEFVKPEGAYQQEGANYFFIDDSRPIACVLEMVPHTFIEYTAFYLGTKLLRTQWIEVFGPQWGLRLLRETQAHPKHSDATVLRGILPAMIEERKAIEANRPGALLTLDQMFAIYTVPPTEFMPEMNMGPVANRTVLALYPKDPLYAPHQQTAKVYFDGRAMHVEDARVVMTHRDPVNMGMERYFNAPLLQSILGPHGMGGGSTFLDATLKKRNGESFLKKPHTVSVYAETFLWPQPGNPKGRKAIACLSVPAVALDDPRQPFFSHYVPQGKLLLLKSAATMTTLAATIVQAANENCRVGRSGAFLGAGCKRLIIPHYGMGAFLQSLPDTDKVAARTLYAETLAAALGHLDVPGLRVQIGGFTASDFLYDTPIFEILATRGQSLMESQFRGAIQSGAETGDFIVNAWDPHSLPGNGNDADRSFDGFMGKHTGILLTQGAWFNPYLRDLSHYVPIGGFD